MEYLTYLLDDLDSYLFSILVAALKLASIDTGSLRNKVLYFEKVANWRRNASNLFFY